MHSFLNHAALQFGKDHDDLERGFPHRVGRVELLVAGYEFHAVFFKLAVYADKVLEGTADSVHLVNDDFRHLPAAYLTHHLHKRGAVRIRSGEALVFEHFVRISEGKRDTGLLLLFDGDGILLVNRLPAVDCDHSYTSFLLKYYGIRPCCLSTLYTIRVTFWLNFFSSSGVRFGTYSFTFNPWISLLLTVYLILVSICHHSLK